VVPPQTQCWSGVASRVSSVCHVDGGTRAHVANRAAADELRERIEIGHRVRLDSPGMLPGSIGGEMRSSSLAAPELLCQGLAEIGEGPVWDERDDALIWVDIPAGRVHRYRPSDGTYDEAVVGQAVGAIVHRERGGYMLAVEQGFAAWDRFGGQLELVAPVEDGIPSNRMNDGKCDPLGRFWAGTMAWDASPHAGALYVLDCTRVVTMVLDRVTISNGLGWDMARGRMYFIDSAERRIDYFAFDAETGEISDRRPLVRFDPDDGLPDGLCVDADGSLWVAMWGGGCVRRITPSGALDDKVSFPVANVSSCTFGGPDLSELFVTTARSGLSSQELEEQPKAGSVFRLRPGVNGQRAGQFGG